MTYIETVACLFHTATYTVSEQLNVLGLCEQIDHRDLASVALIDRGRGK